MTIKTDFGNFGNPKDLLHYMTDEHIENADVTCDYWGAIVHLQMSIKDVNNWVNGKDIYGQIIN